MFQVWCHTLDGKVNSLLLLGPELETLDSEQVMIRMLSYMSRCYVALTVTNSVYIPSLIRGYPSDLPTKISHGQVPWYLMMGYDNPHDGHFLTPESTGRITRPEVSASPPTRSMTQLEEHESQAASPLIHPKKWQKYIQRSSQVVADIKLEDVRTFQLKVTLQRCCSPRLSTEIERKSYVEWRFWWENMRKSSNWCWKD